MEYMKRKMESFFFNSLGFLSALLYICTSAPSIISFKRINILLGNLNVFHRSSPHILAGEVRKEGSRVFLAS